MNYVHVTDTYKCLINVFSYMVLMERKAFSAKCLKSLKLVKIIVVPEMAVIISLN